jgi:hypothetical protein
VVKNLCLQHLLLILLSLPVVVAVAVEATQLAGLVVVVVTDQAFLGKALVEEHLLKLRLH